MVKKPVQPKQQDPEQPSVRDLLLDQVRTGEITPDKAEKEARRLGLRPFACTPDPVVFDPMKETWWTIPMTIAWIVWRTPDAVREQWETYRIGCYEWEFRRWNRGPGTPVHEGFELRSRNMTSYALLELATCRSRAEDGRTLLAREARDELWQVMSEGRIECQAIDIQSGERVSIPASAWRDLEIHADIGWDVLRKSVTSRGGYEEVEFPSGAIVHAWPPPARRAQNLPPLMTPTGPGYMPLSAAVQWIATKGGTIEVGLSDTETWDRAYRELADRIASGEVKATGTHEGRSQTVDPALFAGIEIRHLYGADDGLAGADTNELYLYANPYFDEEHWRGGFDDRLQTRWRESWTKLMVLRADVARWWPFDLAPVVSGLPGRPTSAHLLVAEFERRCLLDQVDRSLKANAESLCEWLAHTHPSMPQPKPKSVMDRIRSKHNAYWSRKSE